ncbi:PDDEXK nuclease domain-containing protein [Bdellovibrionota bacterium FG-1]
MILQDNFVQVPLAQLNTYGAFLEAIKARIKHSQISASVSVNTHLVMLYWDVGTAICAKQSAKGWGAKVIDSLSMDLRREFPSMTGFSPRNLKYMRAFAVAYPKRSFVQQALAQLPWYHNITLLEKVSKPEERLWYVQQAITHGWSRTILVIQIENKLYQRQGKALTNFKARLPEPDSDLAQQTLKDPYCFDFLTLGSKAHEQDLERGLLEHIKQFLLELGVGFSFVGNQYRVEVGGDEFFIDLLFYHIKLRCFVVIELKMTDFKAEYAGKLNFYLTAIDKTLRHKDDNPTIGLILCKNKNKNVVEYALQDMTKPIGVSSFSVQLMESLPETLKGQLPTVEQLEAEMETASKEVGK